MSETYAELEQQFLSRDGCERGRILGFPCLRRDGVFFATTYRRDGSLVIKVDAARVDELIGTGLAESFAPNGRRFREWASIPVTLSDTWAARMEEAWTFAGS